MPSPPFVVIPCRSCLTTTIILGDRQPTVCVKCQAPYDTSSASFQEKNCSLPAGSVGTGQAAESPTAALLRDPCSTLESAATATRTSPISRNRRELAPVTAWS
jgi:hypothetical protein